MSLKIKIKERLKVKFPGVNLSKTRLEAIAEKLDTKVTEEEGIDEALDTYNDFYPFADMAKDDDRERLRLKKEADDKAKEEGKDTDPPKVEDVDKDTPAWAKSLLESNKTLANDLAALKGEKVALSRKESYAKILADAPDHFKTKALKDFAKMKFETDEEFNEFLAESETDVSEFIQGENNEGAGGYTPTKGQPREVGKPKIASTEVVDELMTLI